MSEYRYKNSKLEEGHGILNTYLYTLRLLWNFDKGYFMGCLTQAILTGIIPVINIYFPKLIVQNILESKFNQMLFIILLMIGINLALYIVTFYFTVKDKLVRNMFATYLNVKFLKKTVDLDQSLLDNKDIHDLKQKAAESVRQGLGVSFVQGAFSFVSTSITLVPLFILIAPLGILPFVIIVVFLTIDIVAQFMSRKIEYKYFIDTNEEHRKANYFVNILNDDKHKNDLKMYSLAEFIINKYEKVRSSILKKLKKMYVSGSAIYIVSSIAGLLSTAMIYIFLGYRMIFSSMTFDLFTLYLGTMNQLTASSQSLRQIVIQTYQMCRYINHFRSFLELENVIANDDENKDKKEIPDTQRNLCLRFHNVSFLYPQGNDLILNSVNLQLKKGNFYVMVGPNGSGKTTIVKLLCRLYDVSKGEILLNDTNIKDFNYRKYRNIFGTVFQDYHYYNLSIRENITFTDTRNKEGHLDYAIQNSGLNSKIQDLKHGLDTCLGKLFDKNGIELSGGEGQKLAIAKALFRGSEFFILDEPSSALDPEAEHDLIQTFLNLRDEGKTILFISHRLSTVNFADEVIFVNRGKVTQGKHAELMRQIPKYNEMYSRQSSLYLQTR